MAWGAILLVVIAYLGLLLLLRLNESRLIYFPGSVRRLTDAPAELQLPVRRAAIRTEDGLTLGSWVIPAGPDSTGYWVLICHGNAGNLSEFGRPAHYARLRTLGLSLLAFDYRGYGESEGTPSEAGLYRDADAAYKYLRGGLRVPPERIIVFGHSLGSAVAVDLASRVPAAGLILDGALTSVIERGAELYPYIPVRWIGRSRFSSIDKISRVSIPKLFLHARADDVVPLAHGRRLFEAALPPKTFVELNGGHGDAFELDSASYFGSIRKFVKGLGGT
ncbi:MAG TPA: alpha/beta hydrolase [Gemmatimonadales bacterium]|nr:alpha/beta hydrolase [Gemmatimonadales bacterium]